MYTEKVVEATNEIAEKFISKAITLLTESDLKVALSNQIQTKFDSSITVNTESPWYDTYITKQTYYVDITAFDRDKLRITYDPNLNRKGYKYDDEALAIELKYFRYETDINEISKDFAKMALLVKAPKNECFIIAVARTLEIFESAKKFMENQLDEFRAMYNDRITVFLIGTEQVIELR